jgi:hypothetical protein
VPEESDIAPVTALTERRFAFETRATGPSSVATRQQAEALGLPALVAQTYLRCSVAWTAVLLG